MVESLSGNMNKVINLNDYMNIYNNQINNLKSFDNFVTPDINSNALKGNISKDQPATEDQELIDDLSVLTKNNSVDMANPGSSASELTPDNAAKSFSKVIGNFVNNVNNDQNTAENDMATFAAGGNMDLHSVMIASEKAGLSMQLALQMRNKILQAYQEISRMPI